jgi:hypothetical protein
MSKEGDWRMAVTLEQVFWAAVKAAMSKYGRVQGRTGRGGGASTGAAALTEGAAEGVDAVAEREVEGNAQAG